MNAIIRLLVSTIAVLIAAYLLPGVEVTGFWVAFVVAVVLSIINIFIRPILILLTLPITIFTFGLFLLVINALLIQLASAIVPGFEVANFWWAVLFSVLVSFLNGFLGAFSKRPNNAPQQTTYLH